MSVSGLDVLLVGALAAWSIWAYFHPKVPGIVDPGAKEGPSIREFEALSGKVKQLALEWEDTHERLLRMARSARASARKAAANGNGDEDEPNPEPVAAGAGASLSRREVLAEYRRRHAGLS